MPARRPPTQYRAFGSQEVEEAFLEFPERPRGKLLDLRELIFETADRHLAIEGVAEVLKWGEPSYRPHPKTGTTVRIAWKKKAPEQYALYVPCQTSLVAIYQSQFGDELNYDGKRAVVLPLNRPLPKLKLRKCIELALTYYQR